MAEWEEQCEGVPTLTDDLARYKAPGKNSPFPVRMERASWQTEGRRDPKKGPLAPQKSGSLEVFEVVGGP